FPEGPEPGEVRAETAFETLDQAEALKESVEEEVQEEAIQEQESEEAAGVVLEDESGGSSGFPAPLVEQTDALSSESLAEETEEVSEEDILEETIDPELEGPHPEDETSIAEEDTAEEGVSEEDNADEDNADEDSAEEGSVDEESDADDQEDDALEAFAEEEVENAVTEEANEEVVSEEASEALQDDAEAEVEVEEASDDDEAVPFINVIPAVVVEEEEDELPPTADQLPTFEDVKKAAVRIAGKAFRTPILESAALNERVGGRILIKPECLQRTGSFKFRGAYNRISQIRTGAEGGVVAFSSGNHAQGVAAAAQLKGIPAVIVMPEDTPEIKVRNTKSYGAEVVFYDRSTQNRKAIAQQIADERDAILVPPFDDAEIIAGQGTAGLELVHDLAARGIKADAMLVCTGGGGLLGGFCLTFSELSPETQVFAVEPEDFDDHCRSFAAGQRLKNEFATGSICDALLAPRPGNLTYAINRGRVAGGLTVSDDEVREAMRFAFETLKLVVEPGGAVALAAVLAGKIECKDKAIGVILSGGNVDASLFAGTISPDP
ncbi:MAG: pyridoxal-phosphate dependent enzyme, partial [Hyphomicrobiales bacterium]